MKIGGSPFPASNGLHPWNDNNNSIWLATSVSLLRNIEKFKFPGKLDSDRKKQIIALVSNKLLPIEGLASPYLIKGEDLAFLEKEFLIEHFLSNQNLNQVSSGEGIMLDQSGEFLATLNMRDHIHLQLLDCKEELESVWNRLVKIETALGKAINYSFLPKFGFLTADPTLCGTALQVAVFLQVPALIHSGTIDAVLDKYADESFIITGIQGNPTEIIGDVLCIQNNYTLGINEEHILSSLRNITTKLIVEENRARQQLKRENNADFKDRVSRAFAILTLSYQIDTVEALNALSLLKLGVENGWVTGIANAQLNSLFFNCRRAHLLDQCAEKTPQEEIPHRRAEFIHKSLKDVQLTI